MFSFSTKGSSTCKPRHEAFCAPDDPFFTSQMDQSSRNPPTLYLWNVFIAANHTAAFQTFWRILCLSPCDISIDIKFLHRPIQLGISAPLDTFLYLFPRQGHAKTIQAALLLTNLCLSITYVMTPVNKISMQNRNNESIYHMIAASNLESRRFLVSPVTTEELKNRTWN